MLIFVFKQGRHCCCMKDFLYSLIVLLVVAGCGSNKPSTMQQTNRAGTAANGRIEPWFCQPDASGDQWDCVRSAPLAAARQPARQPRPKPSPAAATPPVVAEQSGAEAEAPPVSPEARPAATGPLYQQLSYRPDAPVALLDLPADFYAVQLVAVSSKQTLEQFAAEHQLAGMSAARIWNGQKIFYVLLLGIYEDREHAERAVESLSGPMAELQPWIRTVGSLQRAMRAADAT